jgi:serine/threonine protein kinase
MELVRGVPITEFCDQRRLTTRQRLELFATVCQAVQHAHHKGIIHRDLEPSNVLILEDGRLVLSDFGLAKYLGTSEDSIARGPVTCSGAVLGTRCYMAPEQEKGQDVAEPADVYALGILLAELAVGDRPPANTGARQGSTLRGWRRLKQLPDGLRRFVLRLTDVLPGRRPADGGTVLREFQALLARAMRGRASPESHRVGARHRVGVSRPCPWARPQVSPARRRPAAGPRGMVRKPYPNAGGNS